MASPSQARLEWARCAAFIGVLDVVIAGWPEGHAFATLLVPSALISAGVALAIAALVVPLARTAGRRVGWEPAEVSIVVGTAAFWWLCDRQLSGYFRAGPSIKWTVLAVGLAGAAAVLVAWCSDYLIRWRSWLGRRSTWTIANVALWILVIGLVSGPVLRARGRALPPVDAPNVLLVTIDTLRADRVGGYGYAGARTPTLDRLAREGVLFRQAISESVFTAPAHATILTGLSPARHGVRTNEMRLDGAVPTLVDRLGLSGWKTFAVVSGFPVQQSGFAALTRFDEYDDDFHDVQGAPPLWWQTTMGRLLRSALIWGGIERQLWYRLGDEVTDVALRKLEQAAPGPFFGWVHYYDPHLPYEAPSEFLSDEARRYAGPADGQWYEAEESHRTEVAGDPAAMRQMSELYDAEVAYADAQLGRLVEAARVTSAGRPLWIFVMADHGESFGEHGVYFSRDVYDQTLRVPLIVWSTTLSGGGREVAEQVRLMDVAPTLLESAGLGDQLSAEGVSLMGLMTGQSGPAPGRSISERIPHSSELIRSYVAVRDGRWKAIWRPRGWQEFGDIFIPTETQELYDLREDPLELRNVAVDHPDVFRDLREWGRRHQVDGASSTGPLSDERRAILRSLGYIRWPMHAVITGSLARPGGRL